MLDSAESETLAFGGPVGRLARPWRAGLAGDLDAIPGLTPDERTVVLAAGVDALLHSLHAKVSRVFLIELHARRLAAGGTGDDAATWAQYIEDAMRDDYLTSLEGRYPVLSRRIEQVARLSVAAVAGFAARLAADRPLFADALRGPLRAVTFGRGDTHRGGLTVSRVDVGDGTIMYKPRNSAIDVALAALIRDACEDFPDAPAPAERIRVPPVLLRDGYAWRTSSSRATAPTSANWASSTATSGTGSRSCGCAGAPTCTRRT